MTKRIAEFDLWRPGYGGAVVSILLAGTTALASVFEDEALTIPAENPQTLDAMTQEGGVRYGKFAKPLYTGQSYFLLIDGIENSGIVRPAFSSLDGEDAGAAVITAPGSSYPVKLSDLAGRSVNVANYGDFVEGSSGVAATNTATLNLAIAALTNGGEVHIPAGTYKINGTSLPEGVILVGDSRESTVLQSVLGAISFTVIGNRAGFKDITLDGNSLSSNSVGVSSTGNDEIIFSSVMIRRFETGIHFIGGKGHVWRDFSIENVVFGALLHGDTDTGGGGSGNGDKFEDLIWSGGVVSVASSVGVEMSYEDTVCHNLLLESVGFENCLGVALVLNGCQNVKMDSCWWKGNTVNADVHDDSLVLTSDKDYLNDICNIVFASGRMEDGEFIVNGTLENFVVSDMKLEGVTFNLVGPLKNYLIVQDCFEDAEVIITGDTTRFLRTTTTLSGTSFGLTTSNTAVKAWGISLEPGQIVYLEGKVIGRGRNTANRAIYHIAVGAYMLGATLNYEAQSANFTVGELITGQTSGATARVQADTDSGTTGALTLTDIQGTFIDGEIIVDGATGSARVNGAISVPVAALDTVGVVSLRTAYESDTDWAATFVVNQQEVELRVTGDTNQTVEWTVDVDVVSN